MFSLAFGLEIIWWVVTKMISVFHPVPLGVEMKEIQLLSITYTFFSGRKVICLHEKVFGKLTKEIST